MERFLPYGRQDIDQSDIDAMVAALRSDFLTTGPEIEKFEQALCDYTGARYSVAVANGTAALHLAMLALELPEGASGITSPNTFVASSNAMVYAGIRPRFSDIDAATYVLNPHFLAEELDRSPANVVVPVHFAGNTMGVEQISEICRRRSVRVVEDAAHSIGGSYADGSKVGACRYSDMTTFSFHPVKTITTGEGGAVMTNDPELYRKLKTLRTHGIERDPNEMSANPGPWYYEMQMLGFNYRLTDVQAALGRSQLAKLYRYVARRQELVDRYNNAFAEIPWIRTPAVCPDRKTAWHLYVLNVDWNALGMDRATAMARLKEKGVGSQVLYIPVHAQPYYRQTFGFGPGDFPVAEAYYERALAIPLYPAMTDQEQARVIDSIKGLGRS